MSLLKLYVPALIVLFLIACKEPDPNINSEGSDEFKSLEITTSLNPDEMQFLDEVYIPIYSNIYIDKYKQKTLLAATLSIRNTSYTDSLFVTKVDYYDTDGHIAKTFLDNTINIPPMATVDYVIEKEDDTGGAGANFMVSLQGKNKHMRPMIQAIMIGEFGNVGFAFSTDGWSVGKSNGQ